MELNIFIAFRLDCKTKMLNYPLLISRTEFCETFLVVTNKLLFYRKVVQSNCNNSVNF